MPAEFLSETYVTANGQFGASPSRAQLERFFFLDDTAAGLASPRRRESNRLGCTRHGKIPCARCTRRGGPLRQHDRAVADGSACRLPLGAVSNERGDSHRCHGDLLGFPAAGEATGTAASSMPSDGGHAATRYIVKRVVMCELRG